MAMTKTIQATVKNRTDTAANWTQKNPVLAEGEIIVVQTSAGETRLKIGDGVKTFTQLPYTDEQIYNNVVTSVNGQTGDITIKTAYQYAQDGGYTGTEAEFAAKLASGALIVTLTDSTDSSSDWLADKSYNDIRDAILAGIPVYVFNGEQYLSLAVVTDVSLFFGTAMGINDETGVGVFTILIEITNDDKVKNAGNYLEIPTTLPNPNAITFTGAVNATYDGSTAVSVEIPSGGTDISLGLTSAAVGQTIKVKAVDSNGVPTEWEPETFPGSSSDYVINVTLDTKQSSIGNWVLGYSCTCDKTYAEVLAAYQSGAKVIAHVTRNKEITLSDGSKKTIPIINEVPLTRYIAAQNLLVFDYVHNATDLSVSSGGLTYTTGDSGDSMICYVATYQFTFGATDTSADSVQIPTTTKVQDMIDASVGDINTNTYTIQVSNTAPAAGTSDKIITYVVEEATAG